MNISRLSSQAANIQPASARPFQAPNKSSEAPERSNGSKPHSTHSSQGRETGQVEGAEDHSHDHSQRVANFAAGIENRIANAIQNGNLNDEQIQGLKAAAAQFQQLMERIGNADFSGSPKRQVLFALHQFTHQVQELLHPEGQDQPEGTSALVRGSDSVAAVAAPTIDTIG